MVTNKYLNFIDNAVTHLTSPAHFDPFKNRQEGFFQGFLIGNFLTMPITLSDAMSTEITGNICLAIIIVTLIGGGLGYLREPDNIIQSLSLQRNTL